MNSFWYPHERVEAVEERKSRQARVVITWPAPAPHLDDAMDAYLKGRDLDAALARYNKWYPSCKAGDGLPRIVLPATRTDGGIFWQARSMDGNVRKRYQSPSGARGDALIVVHPVVLRPCVDVVIVEGPMDALAAAGEGALGISLMGNTPNEKIIDHIVKLIEGKDHVIVVADSNAIEEAGIVLAALIGRNPNVLNIRLALPMHHTDLAAASPNERRAILCR